MNLLILSQNSLKNYYRIAGAEMIYDSPERDVVGLV